jgi:hypothetical protein
MKLSKRIKRTIDNTFYKNLISHFFEEVVDDINVLKEHNFYSRSPNPFVNYIYEDDDLELNPKMKEIIKNKYKEKYCPTCLYDYFNKSEKINYLMLRNSIDKLLGITSIHDKF